MRKNPEAQRDLHVATEALALAVVAPGLAYVAWNNPQLPTWQRWFLWGIAAGTVAVDGYLLAKWLEK